VCAAFDEHVEAFRTRPLEGRYPYLFLDAKVEKVRDGGRVVNKALVLHHVLGLDCMSLGLRHIDSLVIKRPSSPGAPLELPRASAV
jgi:hypothetical protein